MPTQRESGTTACVTCGHGRPGGDAGQPSLQVDYVADASLRLEVHRYLDGFQPPTAIASSESRCWAHNPRTSRSQATAGTTPLYLDTTVES